MAATILIIDDDATTRLALAELLEDEDYTVLIAADGGEGLSHLAAHPVDLVLSDVAMPRVDGYELLTRIRENPATAEIPIILWSASPTPPHPANGHRANAFLAKPVSPDSLLAQIRTHVNGHRQRR